MKTIADRIKEGLALRKMKQADLVELTGIGKSSISTYISGQYEPKQRNIYKIAKALNVSESWLMGYDVPMDRVETTSTNKPSSESACSNLISLNKSNFKKVPLIGSIACGVPIFASENIEEYINMDCDVYADFALRCKGDSMINARIFDGDIVYIKKQPRVENGEIAAVVIDNIECEATLKRVFLDDEKIRLCAENPMYKDMIFFHEEMNTIRIIGKAVAFLSNVK